MTLGWLSAGDEVHRAIANQVASTDLFQSVSECWPVVGIVVAEEGFVQAPLLDTSHSRHFFRASIDLF